ncbi:MAG: ImmA/IrrE family metallo-endopeptidase [Anaerolineae bacterium]
MRQEYSDKKLPNVEALLVECLAWGLLRAHGIEGPPVPVREMIKDPLPIFERLNFIELSLGLYDAAYRSCLDGSRLIVVDPTTPPAVQRAGMARELYVAFCHSSRASELRWPHREQSRAYSDLFARCLLMPAAWVRLACAEVVPLENLAVRFGVSVQTMAQRLGEIYRHWPRSRLGEPLTEALFSLKEPWRGRFLDLVANRATNGAGGRQLPTREEVTTWLSGNPGLYQDVRYMLDAWQGPKRRLAYPSLV